MNSEDGEEQTGETGLNYVQMNRRKSDFTRIKVITNALHAELL